MPIDTDARIKFQQTIQLDGPSAIVSAEVFGGPIIALQVAVFNAEDQLIDGIGFDDRGEPLTSEENGSANWLFKPSATAAYIKWGVVAIRSAANLGHYSVTGKVRDGNGNTLISGRFAGSIPDGDANDGVVYDGVKIGHLALGELPKGAQA